MCLGGGIPSPANIRLLYPGRRYIRIYPSSSNRDAYAAKSSLSFSSSLCNARLMRPGCSVARKGVASRASVSAAG